MEIIKNELDKGRVFINKLSAGERQLAAAIRLYFLNEDPLAIHTVISAAHNLLADLLNSRGKDPSVHGLVYGALRAARDLREGAITEEHIRAWGDGALECVKQLSCLFDQHPELEIEDLSSSAPPDFARKYWSDRRHAYNFLKHADRDASGSLDEAMINNENSIVEAIVCSQHLNTKHTKAKHLFLCAMTSLGKVRRDSKQPFDLEVLFSGLSKEEIMAFGRRNLCQASFQDDDILLESVSRKMKENASSLKGKDVLFFKFD